MIEHSIGGGTGLACRSSRVAPKPDLHCVALGQSLTACLLSPLPLCVSCPVIPPFHHVIDQAASYLAQDGFMGVCDFFVSGKYDLPMRQMPWSRRFFWR